MPVKYVILVAAVAVALAGVADAADMIPVYATKADERAGQPSGHVAAAVRAGGDTCATAPAVTTTPFNDSGSTVGATNNNNNLSAGCSDYTTTAGPDHVYSFVAGVGASLTFTLSTSSSSYDPSIYLLSACDAGTTNCVTGSDSGLAGVTESFSASGLTLGATYYFYVDSFYSTAAGSGPYTVDITGVVPVELGSFSVE